MVVPNKTCSHQPHSHEDFVHKVLKRSRTSACFLQTALCYLEAIPPEFLKFWTKSDKEFTCYTALTQQFSPPLRTNCPWTQSSPDWKTKLIYDRSCPSPPLLVLPSLPTLSWTPLRQAAVPFFCQQPHPQKAQQRPSPTTRSTRPHSHCCFSVLTAHF